MAHEHQLAHGERTTTNGETTMPSFTVPDDTMPRLGLTITQAVAERRSLRFRAEEVLASTLTRSRTSMEEHEADYVLTRHMARFALDWLDDADVELLGRLTAEAALTYFRVADQHILPYACHQAYFVMCDARTHYNRIEEWNV